MVLASRMSWNSSIEYYHRMQQCVVCWGSKGYMQCPQCGGRGGVTVH
jgi:DnaJ-class molecular chaperone